MVVKKQEYLPVSQQQYDKIMEKYSVFLDVLGDPDKEPVSPYHPLSQRSIDELELIREVSRELQKKKEEDINRAAQAAKEAEEAAAKKEEESKTEAEGEQQEKVE